MNAPQSNTRNQWCSENSASSDAHARYKLGFAGPPENGGSTKTTSDMLHNSDLQHSATHSNNPENIPPCYFLNLPAELRHKIFSYLMPEEPVRSIIIYDDVQGTNRGTIVTAGSLHARLPVSLLSILLGFGREMQQDIKDAFYRAATFAIDVTGDGVMLCGYRILSSFARDGYIYQNRDQQGIDQFIRYFDWSAVTNYTVNIVSGRQECGKGPRMGTSLYDDEVEMYDMRDYVYIVVSSVLAKARNLRNLHVSVETEDPDHDPHHALEEARMLIEPFMRLRCVQNPRFLGVFHNNICYMTHIHRYRRGSTLIESLCARSHSSCVPFLTPEMPDFASFAPDLESTLAIKAAATLVPASPMMELFIKFKALHDKIRRFMPAVVRQQRQCFLHRARIAREEKDIGMFRAVEAELMACWQHQLQLRELERQEVERAFQGVVAADVYPGRGGS